MTAAAQLGGTERVLLDFANDAFEYGIALRVLAPRPGPLVDRLNDLGVPADVVPAPPSLLAASQRAGHLRSIPPALFGLRRWAKDLAKHAWCEDAEVLYSVAFKAYLTTYTMRKIPVVWHLHEFPPERTGRLWRFFAGRIPDALIANSHAVGSAWGKGHAPRPYVTGEWSVEGADWAGPPIARSGGPPIAVIPNGVNLDRFTPRKRTGWIHQQLELPREARLVGMPAVFARWKGQLEVIEAFRLVANDFSDVHLVFVGGSIYDTVAERSFEKELRAAIRPGTRIHLLPFQEAIERVYPEFDLALHYSTRPEPFGRVVLEAMASGIPVVAAAEGGPLEILGGGIAPLREGGWLAHPRAPAALASILQTVFKMSREELATIGTSGRQRSEDYFSARMFSRHVAGVLTRVSRE